MTTRSDSSVPETIHELHTALAYRYPAHTVSAGLNLFASTDGVWRSVHLTLHHPAPGVDIVSVYETMEEREPERATILRAWTRAVLEWDLAVAPVAVASEVSHTWATGDEP